MSLWVAAMRGGRYDEAWRLAAATLASRDPAERDNPALPYHLRWVWDGRPFDGRDVLVRCYHGLGDTIQFARFLPLLAQRARSVTVEVQPRLIELLRSIPGVDRWVPFDDAHPLPPADVDLEITELDFALRAQPTTARAPYLHADRALLPDRTIAFCYSAGDWDRGRCVPPQMFEAVCAAAPAITLVSEPTELDVLNPDGCPFDIGTTASLIAGADLVITVDTMVAHLSGALGRPTWLLLKSDPDWRWAPDQPGSAWYPTMRLYAQSSPGDWAGVMARVECDLQARTLLAVER